MGGKENVASPSYTPRKSSGKTGIPSGEVVKIYPKKFSRAVSKKDE